MSASRADDSSPAPFEMTVEDALKLLGVAEGASFDEILRAKNAVLASCKDDQDAIAQHVGGTLEKAGEIVCKNNGLSIAQWFEFCIGVSITSSHGHICC